MAYDPEFYRLYRDYLRERTVRASHDLVFAMFETICARHVEKRNVMDIGCGLGEFDRYCEPERYVGVDRNNAGSVLSFVQADYTDLAFLTQLPFDPNVFVSLFSVEACLPAADRYAFYERLFSETGVVLGLVAGFYYESKRDQATVGETGGIISYQTIEPMDFHRSDRFKELRVLTRTPSKMFGADVVEVWKVLSRK